MKAFCIEIYHRGNEFSPNFWQELLGRLIYGILSLTY